MSTRRIFWSELIVILLSVKLLAVEPFLPEPQYAIGPDGNFLDSQGKPRCLIGSQISIYSLAQIYRTNPSQYPAEYEYIYHRQPDYETMKRVGFNTMCMSNGPVWLRTLFPDYSGYRTNRPIQDVFNECMLREEKLKSMRFFSPNAFDLYAQFFRNLKMPIYVECTIADSSRIFRNKKDPTLQQLVGGETAFTAFDNNSTFFLGFSLGTSEGRAIYLKCWRYAAEGMKAEGGQALAYELFNEPKYNDPSPANRTHFAAWLDKKYGNIAALNRIYHKKYQDFKEVAAFNNPYAHDFPALGVDWAKFMQDMVIDICEEGRKTLREVDPSARIAVQPLGQDQVLAGWHNFDLYRVSKMVDIINTGTSGFPFCDAEGSEDDSLPTIDTPSLPRLVRLAMLNSRVWMALADGKPLLDGELYTGNTYGSVYSRIWGDIIRGHNATYLFAWAGAGGKLADVAKHPYLLLNQNYFKPEGFKAIADAHAEIDSLSDFILPRANRPKAQIAQLISTPTIRYDFASQQDNKHNREWTTSAVALAFAQYPFDAIFEEQLPEKSLSRYKVLLADNVSNLNASTLPVLRRYVENGGVLAANRELLDLDEYGNPLPNPLFNLKTTEATGEVGRLARLGVKAKPNRKIVAAPGWTTVDTFAGQPAVLKKPCGKGWLYYLAAELPDYSLAEVYREILKTHGVEPLAALRRERTDERPANVELHRADHDGMTLWYFMNCDSYPKIVRFAHPSLRGNNALEPLRKRSLTIAGNEMTVLLPPQKPVVVVTGPEAKLTARFGQFPLLSKEEMSAQKAALLAQSVKEQQITKPGHPLVLESWCNKGFDNVQSWPTQSAWFDAKHKDLVGFAYDTRRHIFNGVDCKIIRNDMNDNKTCIALASKNLPDGTPDVTIPVGEKVKAISFFQAVTHGRDGEKVMVAAFQYADGSKLEVPVIVGENIGDWNIDRNNDKIKKMTAWKNPDNLGFSHWEWLNPHPERELANIKLVAAHGEAVPIVVAVTTHPADKPMQRLDLANWKFKGLGKRAVQTADGFEISGGGVKLTSPDGQPLPIPADKLETAVIRYEINNRPDEWGARKMLDRTSLTVTGTKADGKAATTSAAGSYETSNITRTCVQLDNDPTTWQEITVPLKVVLVAHPNGRIEHVTGLTLWTNQNDCPVLIRNLRVEYETP